MKKKLTIVIIIGIGLISIYIGKNKGDFDSISTCLSIVLGLIIACIILKPYMDELKMDKLYFKSVAKNDYSDLIEMANNHIEKSSSYSTKCSGYMTLVNVYITNNELDKCLHYISLIKENKKTSEKTYAAVYFYELAINVKENPNIDHSKAFDNVERIYNNTGRLIKPTLIFWYEDIKRLKDIVINKTNNDVKFSLKLPIMDDLLKLKENE